MPNVSVFLAERIRVPTWFLHDSKFLVRSHKPEACQVVMTCHALVFLLLLCRQLLHHSLSEPGSGRHLSDGLDVLQIRGVNVDPRWLFWFADDFGFKPEIRRSQIHCRV